MTDCESVGYDGWEYTGVHDMTNVSYIEPSEYISDCSSDTSSDCSTLSDFSEHSDLSLDLSIELFPYEYKPRRRTIDVSIVLLAGVIWALWKVP